MDKKSIIFVLIIIILLLIVGFMGYNLINNNKPSTPETVLVGTSNFTLPDGYYVGKSNNYGDLNITNGKISIFLLEYPDGNLSKYVVNYENSINQSVVLTNFTYNNIVVFKGTPSIQSNTVHYWYVCNNKTYSVYSWDYNNIDDIVKELIQLQKF